MSEVTKGNECENNYLASVWLFGAQMVTGLTTMNSQNQSI